MLVDRTWQWSSLLGMKVHYRGALTVGVNFAHELHLSQLGHGMLTWRSIYHLGWCQRCSWKNSPLWRTNFLPLTQMIKLDLSNSGYWRWLRTKSTKCVFCVMPRKSEALRATIFKIQSNKARWKMMKITTIMNRDVVAWNLTVFPDKLLLYSELAFWQRLRSFKTFWI
jgi:hypothetical protein